MTLLFDLAVTLDKEISCYSFLGLKAKPLTPKSDQDIISPLYILIKYQPDKQ